MKFLIPTAKELNETSGQPPQSLNPKSQTIAQELADYSPDQLSKLYKIKPEAAITESQRWQAIINQTASTYPAMTLFHGLMYRQIAPDIIADHHDFIREHVFITSALYGIINGLDPIAPHRLDFNCSLKLEKQSLKQYWRNDYDQFVGKEPIVSLLSSEFEAVFSPNLVKNFIKVSFHEEKDGRLKTHSTISKKGRGLFLAQVIKEQITDPDQLTQLQFAGFTYAPEQSTPQQLVFIKKV